MSKTERLSEKLAMVIIEENPTPLELYLTITLILIAFTPSDHHHLAEPLLDAMKESVLDFITTEKNDE